MNSDHFDDASYENEEVPEDDLVAMMSVNHEFSLDESQLEVLPKQLLVRCDTTVCYIKLQVSSYARCYLISNLCKIFRQAFNKKYFCVYMQWF